MENYYVILLAIAISGLVVYFKFARELKNFFAQDKTKKAIKAACVWAEENIRGTKLGQERLNYVCGVLAKLVPKALQKMVTQEKLVQIINVIFDEIKVEQEDGSTIVREE